MRESEPKLEMLADGPPPIVQAITDGILVASDLSVTNWIAPHPALLDPAGNLRLGAIVFVADGAGGLAGGLASRAGTWVVTADLDVQIGAPIRGCGVRVHGQTVRAGSTSIVCTVDLFADHGADHESEPSPEPIGVGSLANHVHETPMAPSAARWPRDVRLDNSRRRPEMQGSLVDHLAITAGPDGSIELPMSDDIRNPWGILHGGMVGIGAEEVVLRHPAAVDHAAIGMSVRYLAPTRTGPARFAAEHLGEADGRSLFRVLLFDVGADRLTSLATVATVANRSSTDQ